MRDVQAILTDPARAGDAFLFPDDITRDFFREEYSGE
jgi:hypothetical protein